MLYMLIYSESNDTKMNYTKWIYVTFLHAVDFYASTCNSMHITHTYIDTLTHTLHDQINYLDKILQI